MNDTNPITINTVINAPIEKVWECWTKPEHITKWAFASDDWEAPHAENDVRTGGAFKTRMQEKGTTNGFDFNGIYTNVEEFRTIEYDMEKGPQEEKNRHVKAVFETTPEGVKVTQTFDPENENPEEMQRSGWQSILNNFKKYVENS
jgi:uncharacterized protein YndB with AHSA1/START domain